MVEDFQVSRQSERRSIPAGSLWIPADQPAFEVAVQLFEPEAPDSIVRWGVVSSLFERKIYIGPDLLEEPEHPSLIHGDMWGGNILAESGRITGFLDPAIYFAHAEIELAFSTLFGTFGESFFRRYDEIRPIRPGFFEVRKDIYNLWHLLTHVRLFGAGYLPGIERVLSRHGV